MTLDNVPYCYKEYPPVPEMQCEGHKQPIRWALLLPGIVIGVVIMGGLILKLWT